MKRIAALFFSLAAALLLNFTSSAEETAVPPAPPTVSEATVPETTINQSQPRFMVTGFKLSTESLKPSESSELEIKFKNFSNTKALYNIKLSLTDESGEIKTEGMPTLFVNAVYAGSSYTWKVKITAAQTAQIGEHKLSVSSEYEDKYYTAYSSSDTISVNVTQTVGLDFSGLALPPSVIQGEDESVTINLMNTGKTDLRNCKVDFYINGLQSAGTVFFGEIPAGENKEINTNLRVSADMLGVASGKATVSYEDVFGNTYTKTAELSTTIEKKLETTEPETKEDESKKSFWWLFLVIGVAAGGVTGFAIPTAIHSKKQRKEDELRL